jgi:hypothetical protein
MIYAVTQGQAKVKDMGVLRGKSTGGYRTRFKRHTSNIKNKTQTTDRDGHATSPTTNDSN